MIRPCESDTSNLPPPARGDEVPDVLRLERALNVGPLEIDLSLLRELPARLRADSNSAARPCWPNGRLRGLRAGQHRSRRLCRGASTSAPRPWWHALGPRHRQPAGRRCPAQSANRASATTSFRGSCTFGKTPTACGNCRTRSSRAVDEMIGELCSQAGIARDHIYEITFAGNTTMQQLLCGIDTSALGEVPFAPAMASWPDVSGGRAWDCTSIRAAAAT